MAVELRKPEHIKERERQSRQQAEDERKRKAAAFEAMIDATCKAQGWDRAGVQVFVCRRGRRQ